MGSKTAPCSRCLEVILERRGQLPGAHAMEVSPEEAAHRPSAYIRVGLGAQLRPLFCTSLASGGPLRAVKRPLHAVASGNSLALTIWIAKAHDEAKSLIAQMAGLCGVANVARTEVRLSGPAGNYDCDVAY